MPLSLLIARYFLYVFALLALVWTLLVIGLTLVASAGGVYPANYGEQHVEDVAQILREQDAFDADSIPSPYRYARISADGEVIASDMPQSWLAFAREIVEQEAAGGVAYGKIAEATSCEAVELADGSMCVLAYQLMPTFADKGLRDALPNPQNFMTIAGVIASAVVVAAVAMRASRVISRKMRPLLDVAENIKRENLEFSVGRSNVRQIDDVLRSMDDMRATLKQSLEARWQAEAAQREQVAALAHDLKTPLSIVRANAEFVAEESRELAEVAQGRTRDALRDVAEAAKDAAAGAVRLDGYVRLLIDASTGARSRIRPTPHTAIELSETLRESCAAICHARGFALDFAPPATGADARVQADAAALSRAVDNLVSNAADHAPQKSTLHVRVRVRPSDDSESGVETFAVEVRDEGPGFTPAALAHGCERFFQDDASRGGGHYGLGLSIADDIARAHGGMLSLSNAESGGGIAAIEIPLQPFVEVGPRNESEYNRTLNV